MAESENTLRFLQGYPEHLLLQVRGLLESGRLGPWLEERYPGRHEVQSDKALYRYVSELRQQYLRNAPAIDRVLYDSKLDVVKHALGLHTASSRNHGGRLVAKKEIRIAALFRETPPEFLNMIVVHELAHLKEMEHNKAFYQLCEHMLPGYAQLEFDLRLFLTWRAQSAS
ncbi:MAG: M48 family metallopeptidase [Pedobacter sp.]|nr:M48 family metallopeptidase [Pedobacter sp.]